MKINHEDAKDTKVFLRELRGAQVVIALLSPLIACLFPILAGARITMRAAISSYGARAGTTFLDRLLAKVQRLPRSIPLTNCSFRSCALM
ncbi:MAG: hypothetical protein DYG89_02775 [Caldilinea sp. CFX5]|nr:hypothetical protein [Caldilinea sp. CFX5]